MKIIDNIKKETNGSAFLNLLIGFLSGIIVGFVISPIKKGIAIGSYNGCGNKISDSNKVEKDKNGAVKKEKNKQSK